MSLIDLELPAVDDCVPADVRCLLREADRRIRRFQRDARVPGFVPSDFAHVYRVLHALASTELSPGRLFCEWGSGFGVVTCLAAMLEFDACGIEIEAELIEHARRLADDFSLPVRYLHGSYLTRQDAQSLADHEEFAWLVTGDGLPALEIEPAD